MKSDYTILPQSLLASVKTPADVSSLLTPLPAPIPKAPSDLGYFESATSPSSTPGLSSGSSISSSDPTLTPSSSPIPTEGPASKKKIPRPQNAFMLYRSDFLKRKVVPPSVEKRQHMLSKVVGQCWNMIEKEEKDYWLDRAAEALARHKKMYPDYKFTPAPKGSSRKAKAKSGLDGTSSDKIRELRETYARIAGPAVARSKKQKTAKNQSKLAVDIPFQHCIRFSEKDSSSSSASQPPDSATPSLPPLFPQTPYPHLSNDYPVSLRDQKLQLSATFPRCPDSTSGLPAQTSYEARPTGCGLDVDMNKSHIFSPESVLYDNTMNSDPVSYLVNVQPLMPALREGQLEHNNTSGFDAFTDINLAKNDTSPLTSTGTGDSQTAALNSDLQTSMQSWYPIPNANFEFPNWYLAPGGDHWQPDCVGDMKWSR